MGLIEQITFLFQRFSWTSLLDLLLVTAVFYGVLYYLRDSQAETLVRGVLVLVIVLGLMSTVLNLPAFSWLVRNALPALLFSIPVIFAPEIRSGLRRLGQPGWPSALDRVFPAQALRMSEAIDQTVSAVVRLSARQHGALIILQRNDSLEDFVKTGVLLNARLSAEMLLQIFYPNTPLHDGAVIVRDGMIRAAACVMPLSASGVLERSPEHQLGLRHRAALGISEATDALAVVVSEETGSISVALDGNLTRHLDSDGLRNVLAAAFPQPEEKPWYAGWTRRVSAQERSREESK